MYTNSGTTASYIKLFPHLFCFRKFSIKRLSVIYLTYVAKYTVRHTLRHILSYLIDRIFHTNRCLFAFTSVACSTFNFNEKYIATWAGFNTFTDRSVGAYFFDPLCRMCTDLASLTEVKWTWCQENYETSTTTAFVNRPSWNDIFLCQGHFGAFRNRIPFPFRQRETRVVLYCILKTHSHSVALRRTL